MADWGTIRSDSFLVSSVASLQRRYRSAVADSWFLRGLSTIGQTLGQAAATSRVGAVGRTFGRWTRGSWLSRWLTKEPDTDIIVIDLRETWTVGPVLWILDRLIGGAGNVLKRSGLGRAFRTAPVQLLGIIAFIAVLINTLAITVLGSLTEGELGVRLILLAVATLATRVDASWSDLQSGRVAWLLEAIFRPPELPDEENESADAGETDDHRTVEDTIEL